ncbi:GerMN domain-containing protein [Dendrosporobacter sp. 1207_IL3150]|uniref:GerMN domain-containing protein n=1 Tax=Dendrosporobacter sp. 1207_IL3150 TaxID=3084054 RepID=UPI002FDA83B4
MKLRQNYLLLLLLLIAMLITGCSESNQPSPNVPPAANDNSGQADKNSAVPAQNMMKITVYHATKDASNLVAEAHIVPNNDHPAKTAVELLISGTKQAELVSAIPAGTKLRSIRIKDHTAYVDFNDKLIKNSSGGSAGEILLVGAIVNTLTEFPDIQKVQILVDGKKVDTINGHLDTSEPLGRSENIIKK